MPQIIEVPGVGDVEFPDDMNDHQIATALRADEMARDREAGQPTRHERQRAAAISTDVQNEQRGARMRSSLADATAIPGQDAELNAMAQDAMREAGVQQQQRYELARETQREYARPGAGERFDRGVASAMSLGLTERGREPMPPPRDLGEAAAGVVGTGLGYAMPGPGNAVIRLGSDLVKPAVAPLAKAGANAIERIIAKAAMRAGQGMGGGAALGTAEAMVAGKNPQQQAEQAMETAAGFGLFGGALGTLEGALPEALMKTRNMTFDEFRQVFPNVVRNVAEGKGTAAEAQFVQDVEQVLRAPEMKAGPGRVKINVEQTAPREWTQMSDFLTRVLDQHRRWKISGEADLTTGPAVPRGPAQLPAAGAGESGPTGEPMPPASLPPGGGPEPQPPSPGRPPAIQQRGLPGRAPQARLPMFTGESSRPDDYGLGSRFDGIPYKISTAEAPAAPGPAAEAPAPEAEVPKDGTADKPEVQALGPEKHVVVQPDAAELIRKLHTRQFESMNDWADSLTPEQSASVIDEATAEIAGIDVELSNLKSSGIKGEEFKTKNAEMLARRRWWQSVQVYTREKATIYRSRQKESPITAKTPREVEPPKMGSQASQTPSASVVVQPDAAGAPVVSVPAKDVPTTKPTEQKKFLLAEIDTALASAPEQSVHSDPEFIKQHDAILSNRQLSAGVLAEARNLARSRGAQISNDDYPLGWLQRHRLKGYESVTIEVPNDGTFTIRNDKATLAAFKEKAKKFPTTPAKPDMPSAGGPRNPAKIETGAKRPGAQDVGTWEKTLQPLAGTDETRAVLMAPYYDPKHKSIVATDGRRATVVLGMRGASPGMQRHVAKIKGDSEGMFNYPNWPAVVPGFESGKLPKLVEGQREYGVSVPDLHRKVKQALAVFGKGAHRSLALIETPAGIEVSSYSMAGEDSADRNHPDNGTAAYRSGDQSAGKPLVLLSADYVDDLLTFMAKAGNDTITLRITDHLTPIVAVGQREYQVLMPIRAEDMASKSMEWKDVPGDRRNLWRSEPAKPARKAGGNKGKAGFMGTEWLTPVANWLRPRLSPTKGVGREVHDIHRDLLHDLEKVRLQARADELRLRQTVDSLKRRFSVNTIQDAIVQVQDGRMTPADFSVRFGLATNDPVVRSLEKMARIGRRYSHLISKYPGLSDELKATIAANRFYQTRRYQRWILGDDYRPDPGAVLAAQAEVEAGLADALDRMQRRATRVGWMNPAAPFDALGFMATGDVTMLAGLPPEQARAAQNLHRDYKKFRDIVSFMAWNGVDAEIHADMAALQRAARDTVAFHLEKPGAGSGGGGNNEFLSSLRQRYLEGAFRLLYGEITDPAMRQRITAETQGQLLAHMVFFNRVLQEAEGIAWSRMPNKAKGFMVRLGSEQNAGDRKRYGDLAGAYVTQEFYDLVNPPKNVGATAAAARALWFGPMAFQRMSKLVTAKTVARNYLTALSGFATGSGDIARPGFWKHFAAGHKLAALYARGDVAATEEMARLAGAGAFRPDASHSTMDVEATLGGMGEKAKKLGKKITRAYAFLDFPTKYAAYMCARDRGLTAKEAADHVARLYQNRDVIPGIVNTITKTGAADYLGYSYDSLRIRTNQARHAVESARKGDLIPLLGFTASAAMWLLLTNEARKKAGQWWQHARGGFDGRKGTATAADGSKVWTVTDPDGTVKTGLSEPETLALRNFMNAWDRDGLLGAWREKDKDGKVSIYYTVWSGQTAWPVEDALMGAFQVQQQGGDFLTAAGNNLAGMVDGGMYLDTVARLYTGRGFKDRTAGDRLGMMDWGKPMPEKSKAITESLMRFASDMTVGAVAAPFQRWSQLDEQEKAGQKPVGPYANTMTKDEALSAAYRLVRTYRLDETDFNRKVRGEVSYEMDGFNRAKALIAREFEAKIRAGGSTPSQQDASDRAQAYRIDAINRIRGVTANAKLIGAPWYSTGTELYGIVNDVGLSGMESLEATTSGTNAMPYFPMERMTPLDKLYFMRQAGRR